MCINFTYDCKPCKLNFNLRILNENGPVITPYQDIRCPHFKLSDHFDLIHGIINNLMDNNEVTFCGYDLENRIHPSNHKSFIIFLNNHHDWRRPQSDIILSSDDDSD
jgi:hypothetical protein